MENVLVLSNSYEPIACAPWQSAIVWVLEKLAEVVEEHPDKYIHTVRWAVKMPSVVRLVKPINRKRAIKFSRQNVYLRDNGRCGYCGIKVSRDDWTYDHVIPRMQGGKTNFDNVVCCCTNCNQRKGGRSPAQASMRLLVQPIRPKKLPNVFGFGMEYKPNMPNSWKNWLRDAAYWKTELEHD